MTEVRVHVDPGHQAAPEAEPLGHLVVVDLVGGGRRRVEGDERMRLEIDHPWRLARAALKVGLGRMTWVAFSTSGA